MKFPAKEAGSHNHPLNGWLDQLVPKAFLASWWTGKQAPSPRPLSPDFAGILRIPAAKSAHGAVHAAGHDWNLKGPNPPRAFPAFCDCFFCMPSVELGGITPVRRIKRRRPNRSGLKACACDGRWNSSVQLRTNGSVNHPNMPPERGRRPRLPQRDRTL